MKYTLIITTAHEPDDLKDCLMSASYFEDRHADREVLVVAPDKKSKALAEQYGFNYIKDEGKGKIAALNLGLKHATGDVIAFTDGDCTFLNLYKLIDVFQDEQVGLASGRVMSKKMKNKKWQFYHRYLLGAADYIRRKKDFVEATGYLFAIRRNLFNEFPYDVAEDSWASATIYQKGYKTVYVPEATVFVKGPESQADWIKQKMRCALAHERQEGPKIKTFKNEMFYGLIYIFKYKYSSIWELLWLPNLYIMRLYVWVKVKEMTEKGLTYGDGWETVKSTKVR